MEPLDASQWDIHPYDCFIGVMGITGSGKSNFIARCTQELMLGDNAGLDSSTQSVSLHSMKHKGRVVHLFDVPGFSDTQQSDVQILQQLAYWLVKATEFGFVLDGLIWLHNMESPRFQGADLRALNTFKALCGSLAYPSIVLAASRCDIVPPAILDRRLDCLRENERMWRDLLQGGATVARFQNNRTSALSIIDKLLGQRQKLTLQIQQELIEEHKTLIETAAGKVVYAQYLETYERLGSRLEDASAKIQSNIAQHQGEATKCEQRNFGEAVPLLLSQTAQIESLSMSTSALISEMEATSEAEAHRVQGLIESADQELEFLQSALRQISLRREQMRTSPEPLDEGELSTEELVQEQAHDLQRDHRRLLKRTRQLERERASLRKIQNTRHRQASKRDEGMERTAKPQRIQYSNRPSMLEKANAAGTWAGAAVGVVGVVAQAAAGAALCNLM